MLILFFTIIFIAEVIITVELVYLIRSADSKVCSINSKVMEINPQIDKGFNNLRIAINKILLSLNKFEQKIATHKNKYKIIIAKNIVTWVLLLALNMSNKKISSIVDLIFAVNDLRLSR